LSKYHSKKAVVNGIEFDSKKEARRYIELKMLERSGEISDLQRQVKYNLIPTQKQGKKTIERACDYYADFVYRRRDGCVIVEDTKGVKTPEYIIKRKLMLWEFGIQVKEV
jgi:hypothetical protein